MGMALKNALSAGIPPADAPIPTVIPPPCFSARLQERPVILLRLNYSLNKQPANSFEEE
jgi:hypothetical protein